MMIPPASALYSALPVAVLGAVCWQTAAEPQLNDLIHPKGIPITRFCDEQQFTTRQRLELFADVCSAITHAHQKGVIHRDIKPSNVMVTLNGDRPVVKVIDFGIAKATQGRLTDKTLFTHFAQFIGTPAYMSPEQAPNRSRTGRDQRNRCRHPQRHLRPRRPPLRTAHRQTAVRFHDPLMAVFGFVITTFIGWKWRILVALGVAAGYLGVSAVTTEIGGISAEGNGGNRSSTGVEEIQGHLLEVHALARNMIHMEGSRTDDRDDGTDQREDDEGGAVTRPTAGTSEGVDRTTDGTRHDNETGGDGPFSFAPAAFAKREAQLALLLNV